MAKITYYTLECNNIYEGHYYYFAGMDDVGNVLIIDEPSKSLRFQHDKEAKEFLEKHPNLIEQFHVQSMITYGKPWYYVEFKPIMEVKNLSIVQKVV